MSDEQMTLFDVDESTSSPEAILASPSHSPASKKALKTIATSGRQCLSLLSKKDPLGSLAKMLLVTSRWGSTRCFLTWKVKATPQGRLLFQLAPSMPRTEETESGLLHTPTAKANQMSPDMQKRGSGWGPKMWATPRTTDGTGGPRQLDEKGRRVSKTNPNLVFGANLSDQARMWPTPQAADHKNMDSAGQKMLSSEVKLWPTPNARDWKDSVNTVPPSVGKTRGHSLGMKVAEVQNQKMWPTPRASEWKGTGPLGSKSHNHRLEKGYLDATVQERSQVSGSLNPTWVEWLMGYPEGWTDLNH